MNYHNVKKRSQGGGKMNSIPYPSVYFSLLVGILLLCVFKQCKYKHKHW